MRQFTRDPLVALWHGDVLEVLRSLPDASVQCCVTSPPYWGLRDYGVDGQIGLEPSIEDYVQKMVEVFRAVRRVLHPTGTLWLNIGDSYIGSGKGQLGNGEHAAKHGEKQHTSKGTLSGGLPTGVSDGLKAKDLAMIPARVALALQQDGWWLRSEITWVKKAPMPESVTDRPTSATEKVYLLTKAERYYYDADAVREEPLQWYGDKPDDYVGKDFNFTKEVGGIRTKDKWSNPKGRNMRNAWILGPEPYPKAHFATFPTEIPRRAILAGTSEAGCCSACGAPWERVVEREQFGKAFSATKYDKTMQGGPLSGSRQAYRAAGLEGPPPPKTTGWRPTCACDAPTTPCTVLDPFIGSGTTCAVAKSLNRKSIGIDLSQEYLLLAQERVLFTPLPLPLGMTPPGTEPPAQQFAMALD